MSNIPRVYRSTDPGAPVLNGQPGSLAAVLDAVLVDGYGSGGGLKESLGWIRAHTGLNKRSYRNDPMVHSGQHLRVDDSFGRYALIDGFEAMSSVESGSQRFDTTSSAWTKSTLENADGRGWLVVGTSQCFYLSMWIAANQSVNWFAGDYQPLNPSDISRFGYSKSSSPSYFAGSGLFSPQANLGLRVARNPQATPGSGHMVHHRSLLSGGNVYGASGFPYPLPTTNGIFLQRALLNENSSAQPGVPRGLLPGVWCADHNIASLYDNGAVYGGFLDLPVGTQLLALKYTFGSPNATAFVDITNPW